MVDVFWAEPALYSLDEIVDYIALDNPRAAKKVVVRVFDAVERLAEFPASGREPPELPTSIYREVVVPPCRVFYRHEDHQVTIVHVMREERQLRRYMLGLD